MIVVIGAGPAGLAAAWALCHAGRPVVVVDAADRLGGPTAPPVIAGAPVDLPWHHLRPSMSPGLRRLLDEVADVGLRHRSEQVRMGDRWIGFPLVASAALRQLPVGVTARLAGDVAGAPLRRRSRDSYAVVARHRAGGTAWRMVLEPHAWKRWGTDPASLAGSLARDRLAAGSPGELVRDAFRSVRHRPMALSLPRGVADLWEVLAERIGDVRLRTKVTGLIAHDDRVIVGLGDGRIITASHVVSTVPVTQTAAWLGAPAAGSVRHRGVVNVLLTVGGGGYRRHDVHHLPDRRFLPVRVSVPSGLEGRTSPDRRPALLCAEIPCWEGDAVWTAPDRDLALRVCDDLVRSGLPAVELATVDVDRRAGLVPVVTPDALALVAAAERTVARSTRIAVPDRRVVLRPDDVQAQLEAGLVVAGTLGDP